MRNVGLAVLLAVAVAATLSAQRSGMGFPSTPRPGVGSVGTTGPNILYPGSPSGGRPGSILTPGTPRSPGASALPATPGAARQTRPAQRPRRGPRVFRRGAYAPVYGYGYGGVYIDSGEGPVEVEEEEAEGSGSEYVITVPPKKPAPNPRVYDLRETPDGGVEMRDLRDSAPSQAQADYWLIALNGGLIYAAERYWMQHETFRFTTVEGKEFVVSPSELNRDFTKRLNADLGREFVEP